MSKPSRRNRGLEGSSVPAGALGRQRPGRANAKNGPSHLNGAAIIDEQGQEIPITEDMITEALRTAHSDWVRQRHERSSAAPVGEGREERHPGR